MKVIYDSETDTLTVIFTSATVAESDEDKPGVILDYELVSLAKLFRFRIPENPSLHEVSKVHTTACTYWPGGVKSLTSILKYLCWE